jgi:hypothetical protein
MESNNTHTRGDETMTIVDLICWALIGWAAYTAGRMHQEHLQLRKDEDRLADKLQR